MAEHEGELGLDHVAALSRTAADAGVDEETNAAGRARLLVAARRIAEEPRLRDETARRGLGWRTAALVAALLAVTVFAVVRYSDAPLSYEARGNASVSTGYIGARDDAPADVRFSDGSNFVAEPRTRLRIEQATSRGARVLVERGGVTANVRHQARSSWTFVAGPFEVRVTGTKLTIAWDPEIERIDVVLHGGSVEIDSPMGPSHYVVSAGHSFHASVRDGTVMLGDDRNPVPETQSATSRAAPSSADAPSGAGTSTNDAISQTPKANGAPAATEEPWSKRVRLGEFADVVAAARARGVADCLAKCSSSDLRALADAARYTGAAELATEALHALRSRFKGSRDGAAASFLLGRTAESTGDLASADQWYATYLSESPSGPIVADALAGRMLAADRLGAPSRARDLAREYVKRFPEGAAARVARKFAGE